MPRSLEADDRPASSRRLAELRPGARLGRYELLAPIAAGGMARVWAAREHGASGTEGLVAIKTILPHLARDGAFEQMFLDEARIASLVHHPNVCETYELGEERGPGGQSVLYLAMEWVFGDSLAHLLRGGAAANVPAEPVDLRIAVRIVADAARGLHAAHELVDEHGRAMGVVHRDVSPQNILVGADGLVKVTDFGVAKALGQTAATAVGQLKGKIHYMAPEQVTGAAVDRRSDLFALGCVLYELTTGVTPFRGAAEHQVMQALLRGEYVPPGELLPGYPQELERIVVRALAPRPADRFPTADALRRELEAWLMATGGDVPVAHVASTVKHRLREVLERRDEQIRNAGQGASASVPPMPTGTGSASGVLRSGERPPAPAWAMTASTPSPALASPSTTSSGVRDTSPAILAPQIRRSSYVLAAALGVAAALMLVLLAVLTYVVVHREARPSNAAETGGSQ